MGDTFIASQNRRNFESGGRSKTDFKETPIQSKYGIGLIFTGYRLKKT
jgi:hypothetical protein